MVNWNKKILSVQIRKELYEVIKAKADANNKSLREVLEPVLEKEFAQDVVLKEADDLKPKDPGV